MNRLVAHVIIWCLLLPPRIYAQDAIEIEIDSAPVEVEIQKPVPAEQPAETQQKSAETEQPDEEPGAAEEKATKKRSYGVAIAIGAVVAAALAALGGGGGGGGGTDTPPQHP